MGTFNGSWTPCNCRTASDKPPVAPNAVNQVGYHCRSKDARFGFFLAGSACAIGVPRVERSSSCAASRGLAWKNGEGTRL